MFSRITANKEEDMEIIEISKYEGVTQLIMRCDLRVQFLALQFHLVRR